MYQKIIDFLKTEPAHAGGVLILFATGLLLISINIAFHQEEEGTPPITATHPSGLATWTQGEECKVSLEVPLYDIEDLWVWCWDMHQLDLRWQEK